MTLLIGTSKGIYIGRECCQPARHVRDLLQVGEAVYAGTAEGVLRSDDLGVTWSSCGLEDYEVWQLKEDSLGRLWAACAPADLFYSDDGGNQWQGVPAFNDSPLKDEWCIPVEPPVPSRARALVIDRENPARLLVGVEVGGIMRSLDRGETWEIVLPGENPDIHMMFQSPDQPDVVFVSTGYGRLDGVAEMVEGNAGVFRSEDFGQSWEYRWVGVEPRYSRPMCIAQGSLTVASAPHAFSSYKGESGAQAMLFQSHDEGSNWVELCAQPSVANFHGLTNDPEVPGAVFVGTDTGEVWHVEATNQWQQKAQDLPPVLSLASLNHNALGIVRTR